MGMNMLSKVRQALWYSTDCSWLGYDAVKKCGLGWDGMGWVGLGLSLNRTKGKDSRVRLRTNLSITCCAIKGKENI